MGAAAVDRAEFSEITHPATAADVVHVLPHARDLPPLPGYYAPAPNDSTHLYATALATLPG